MKKLTAAALSALILILSPGLGCYQAAAQMSVAVPEGPAPVIQVAPGADIPVSGQAAPEAISTLGTDVSGLDALRDVALEAPQEGGLRESAPALGADREESAKTAATPSRGLSILQAHQAILQNAAPASNAAPQSKGGIQAQDIVNEGPEDFIGNGTHVSGIVISAEGQSERLGVRFDQNAVRSAAAIDASEGSIGRAINASAVSAPSSRKRETNKYRGQVLMLVGTKKDRPFILQEAREVADELGMRLVLVDTPDRRDFSRDLVPAKDFISADVENHDPKNVANILDQVSAWVKRERAKVAVSYAGLQPNSQLGAKLADRLKAKGDPGDAIDTAHTKSKAREVLRQKAPHLNPAFTLVDSAEAARQAFPLTENGKAYNKVVIKPNWGGGSQGVLKNIDSADKAAESYTKTDQFLEEFKKRPDAGFESFDQKPPILMEGQMEGPEVDLELVVRPVPLAIRVLDKILGRQRVNKLLGRERVLSKSGKLEADFWHVSDNPTMDKDYAIEKGVTFPSQLPRHIQIEIRDAGLEALEVMGFKHGNAHVELFYTAQGAKIIEVNKRPGGAFVIPLMKVATGARLVRASLRSYLGLPAEPYHEPEFTLEARLAISPVSGILEKVEGADEAKAMPGIERVVLLKEPGDPVRSLEKDQFDYPLYLSAIGKDYDEAMDRILAALKTIKLHIRNAEGKVEVIDGTYSHVKEDPNKILAEVGGSVQGSGREGQQAKKGKLPKSFYVYLLGVDVDGLSQEAIAVLKPLYALGMSGLGFAVLTQAIEYGFRIPGALYGAKYIKRFDPRLVSKVAILAEAAVFAALGATHLLGGGAILVGSLFIGYSVLRGLAYGAKRGVAEGVFSARIIGQDSENLLKLASNLYFVTVEPLCFIAAMTVGALKLGTPHAAINNDVAAMIAAGVLAAASIPYFFIKFIKEKAAAAVPAPKTEAKEEEEGGTADKLPLKEYLPFVFYKAMHSLIYGLLAWSFATEVLHRDGFNGTITALYDIGSFGIAFLATFLPKLLLPKWSDKHWVLAATVPVIGFLWASLLTANTPLILGMASLLGAAVTAVVVQSSAKISHKLKVSAQADAFKWANVAGFAGAVLPMVLIKGGLVLSSSTPAKALLTALAVILSAAAVGVAWLSAAPLIKAAGQKIAGTARNIAGGLRDGLARLTARRQGPDLVIIMERVQTGQAITPEEQAFAVAEIEREIQSIDSGARERKELYRVARTVNNQINAGRIAPKDRWTALEQAGQELHRIATSEWRPALTAQLEKVKNAEVKSPEKK